MDNSKSMGQVFTPVLIVQFILDTAGFTATGNILGKTIYEPSFGRGVFLYEIVDRLIARGKAEGLSPVEISSLLDESVFGVEYDAELFVETLEALSAHVEGSGVPSPQWSHLLNGDALGTVGRVGKHDFVVGNPPYIRVHNLTDEMRENIERFALTSTGTPDMYVTFMEYGLSALKDTGKLAYIVPNSWLKNTSQKEFREYLFHNRLVENIHDFMSEKVFSNVGTYTAVVVLSHGNTSLDYSQKECAEWVTSTIPYEELDSGETWLFQSPKNQTLLRENRSRPKTFGDICLIQNALMTMRNSIYLAAAEHGAEEGALFDAVKASTYKGEAVKERILFPYRVEGGTVSPYSEDEFRGTFPKAYAYLLANKEELLARKRDVSADWFHYGRSQGVGLLPLKRKIVFRQHLSETQKTMGAYILPADTLVYGGWFVMEKEGSGYSLEDIKEIMESEEFCTVMRLTGKDMSGGYKELYSKNLKSFGIK